MPSERDLKLAKQYHNPIAQQLEELELQKQIKEEEEGDGSEGKYCTHCGVFKTYRAFHKDASKEDGYRNTCKKCRNFVEKVKEEEERKAKLMADIEKQNLDMLSTLGTGGAFTPHLNEVLEAMMQPFGGVNGLAKHLFAFYISCPAGSEKKFKALKMLVEMSKQVTELGLAERKLDMMEDQDLINVMRRSLADFQQANNLPINALPVHDGYVIDVTQDSTAGG